MTFNSDGAQYAKIENVRKGNFVTLPAPPVKSGYTFGGWYTGMNGTGTVFNSATAVNASMTVYARWVSNPAGGGIIPGADVPSVPGIPGGGVPLPVPVLYTITTSAGEGGTISAAATAAQGSDITVKIKPMNGLIISAVYIDGVLYDLSKLSKDADGSYSLHLNEVSANHHISAEFKAAEPDKPANITPVFELFTDVKRGEWYAGQSVM